jgi:flagellar biosynthetic protein FlhB
VSDQKTEKPTPKKIRDARKKGQVGKSRDITQALLFLVCVGVLAGGGPALMVEAKALFADSFRPEVLTGQLRGDEISRYLGNAASRWLLITAPFLMAVAIVAAGAEFFQVRGLFAPEAIKLKFDKLNIVKGLQNIFFKPRTYLELIKNLVKFALVSALIYLTVRGSLRDIILTARATPETTGKLAASLLFTLLFRVGGLFLVLGAADYFLQHRLYIKDLMMSKDEVKKEHKEEEGDPHIRHARRRLHQQLLAQNVVQNVRRADVVVVNPTHLAIAVEYDEQTMNAPQVTAKGQESMAARIIDLARRNRVPITRNVPLAHSLFDIELGNEVPEDLYEAVAEVLNWVYQLAQNDAEAAMEGGANAR